MMFGSVVNWMMSSSRRSCFMGPHKLLLFSGHDKVGAGVSESLTRTVSEKSVERSVGRVGQGSSSCGGGSGERTVGVLLPVCARLPSLVALRVFLMSSNCFQPRQH